jgi:hypothetical protein
MCNSSLFQAMTMAPEPLEPSAVALLLAPVAFVDEMTSAVTSEPITKKMPMELAKINLFFFFISAFSF